MLGIFSKKDNRFTILDNSVSEQTFGETGEIIIGPSLKKISDNLKSFLPKNPFIGIGTKKQFYFNSETDNKISDNIFIKTIL